MTSPRARLLLAAGLVLLLVAISIGAATALRGRDDAAGAAVADPPGAIPAAFARRSYAPGQRATLRIPRGPRRVTLQIFRVGGERARPQRDDVLVGVPVTRPRVVETRGGRTTVPVGRWRGGLYFARLTRPGRVGYAPFVLRPRSLGEQRVLVVLPTHTWQTYNFRDVDGDGTGDTWYADPDVRVVDLSRPFLNRGVPPHFRGYDRAFLRWLHRHGKRADFISDDDLERVASGDALARLYDLVVFSGHEEYVIAHVLDVVERYRDLGGNLAFLSANTFFYAVERRGDLLFGRERWRDRGRPAAPITGSDYVGWFENKHASRPYVVTGARRAPWLFRGTGLENGDRFGTYGIEVDASSPRSPPGTVVVARIADIFGPGRSAEMTYYETPRGAKVFSAGVLNFGGSLEYAPQSKLMENLWRRLARP